MLFFDDMTVWQPVKEKENTEFKEAVLHLKIDLVSHPANGSEGG